MDVLTSARKNYAEETESVRGHMTFKRSTLYDYAKQVLSYCSLLFQTSYESWMISNMTQLNAITVNDTCFEMCGCLANVCSYFIVMYCLCYVGSAITSCNGHIFHLTKNNPCVRLTNSLKSVLRFLPSSRRRPAILFLILRDVQIIRPLIMARRYSVITRRWTSPTRTCHDSVKEIQWHKLINCGINVAR